MQEEIHYIPKDLEDCLGRLKIVLPSNIIEQMRSGSEKDMIQYHFCIGMWMRNTWGLWLDSRLAEWFNAQGIEHPDDMSGIILHSFWRRINGEPINLEEQVKFYQDYYKKN